MIFQLVKQTLVETVNIPMSKKQKSANPEVAQEAAAEPALLEQLTAA